MKVRSGRRIVLVIVLLFALSALSRLGDGLGPALARAAEGLVPGSDGAGVGQEGCAPGPAAVAGALAAREAEILAREVALNDRAAALALADEVLRGRLDELEQAESKLRATLSLADGAAEADLARLTAVYEAMKPREAALLFEAMDPRFAAGFLGRMRADAAASILAGMSAERGYAISAVIAGRNALAPGD